MKKPFELSYDESDFDCRVEVKVLKGATTPLRTRMLKKYANRYNERNSAPYGVSPNGYPYTCGCSHDCCGCMIRTGMSVEQKQDSYILKICTTYNY